MNRIPFYRAPSGLWLPLKDPPEPPREMRRPAALEHSLVTVGYEMVCGRPSTVDGVVERLQQFSLRQVVYLVSRVTLRLGEYESMERRAEGQGTLAQKLFSARGLGRIAKALNAADPEVDWNTEGVLFHERQTLNLLKLAFLTLPCGVEEPESGSVEPLAEALLMMNDIIDRDPTGGATGEDASQKLELYFLANMLFNQGKSELAEIARIHELLVEPPLDDDTVTDLHNRLERATGLNWEMTWFALRGFHAFFRSRKPEDVDNGQVSMARNDGFPGFDFTDEELDKLYSVAAMPAVDLQQEIASGYSVDDIRPFDVLPFARHPLVTFEDDVFCMSLPLLRDLAGMNLQYRFMDDRVFNEEERRQFFQIRGRVFEDYLQRLLGRTFRSRLVNEKQLKLVAGSRKSCDGVVIYPEGALLFEFKSAIVPSTVRVAESFETYEDRVLGTVLRSSVQIASTIDQIEAGELLHLGVNPTVIRQYIPVTAMIEPIQAPLTHQRLSRLLEERGVYSNAKILPFQVLSVDDLELTEKAADSGASVFELLHGKIIDPDLVGIAFKNYCYLTGQDWLEGHNPHLAQRFKRISKEMLQYFRSRQAADMHAGEENGG